MWLGARKYAQVVTVFSAFFALSQRPLCLNFFYMKVWITLVAVLTGLMNCQQKDTLFEKLPSSKTNVTFKNALEESPDFNVLKYGYFYNGGGVAAGDFNNDGLIDLYFTGNLSANKLYLNKGDLNGSTIRFDDITEKAGVAAADGWNTGVSLVDINADGWLDIYVCRSAAVDTRLRRNILFINNKDLTFTNKAAEYSLDDPAYSTQAAFFDYDRDGDMDCFVLNHSVQEFAGFSRMIGSYKQQNNPNYSSKLYQNQNGKFVDVSAAAGMMSNVLSFGLAVAVSDFNDDGWPDLYVSNDYNENDYLYINQKNGRFRESVRNAMGHTSLYSMGSDAADINNDGRIDLFTLDMMPERNERIKLTSGDDNYDKYQQLLQAGFHHQTMRNMVQLNVGNEGGEGQREHLPPSFSTPSIPIFSEIGQFAGVSNTDWSWAGLFADFDNDGWKDLFVTNGYARDYTNMDFLKFTVDKQLKARQTGKESDPMAVIAKMPAIDEPDYIFRNRSGDSRTDTRPDKLTFENKTADWGFDAPNQSNGAVYADLDNDGDLDLVVNQVNAEAGIYQNHADKTSKNRHLTIRLQSPNPAALIGARVSIWAGGRMQVQEFQPVRGFQSAMYGPLLFGLGMATRVDSVRVRWADGNTQLVRPTAGETLTISYKPTKQWESAAVAAPFWQAVDVVKVTAKEDTVNDFKIQPLLPYMLSETGPRFATGDINGDGLDDVFVGGGRGQGGQVLMQQGGRLVPMAQPALLSDRTCEDAGAEWFDADSDRDLDLLVVSAGYELPASDPRLAARLYLNDGTGRLTKITTFPNVRVSASCVRVADIDKDGDLDVFLGARVVPDRYPETPVSHLLLNDGKGRFSDVTSQQPVLSQLGMVTDAAFADITHNGRPELIVTTDFGPVSAFTYEKGRFQPLANALPATTGCWNKLLIRDFDNDGDPDILVANAGLNSQLRASPDRPLTLYGMPSPSGGPASRSLLPVLASYEGGKLYPFNARDEMLDQVASLRKKFTDYTTYSTATITDLFAPGVLASAQKLSAGELRTVLLKNDKPAGSSSRFTILPLPAEAQFAPAYALAAVDVNADGLLDLIIGGNRRRNRVRLGPADANRGQLFLNGGKGLFTYVAMPQSGLLWSGDVRDLASLCLGNKTALLVGATGQPVWSFELVKE